jgi:membrane-bound serine protease (ClpP class)
MKRIVFICFFTLASLLGLLSTSQLQAAEQYWLLNIKGAIGPATADYLKRGLIAARERDAKLVILRLDTPGGLDLAMRDMVQNIIASPIPVITYIAPAGAHAASAGTYILYASHVAAMAPGTNLGAATPVTLGGKSIHSMPNSTATDHDVDQVSPNSAPTPATGDTMTHKMVNDAEAYLRSLAQLHGRNAAWVTQAVRDSASLSAEEAFAQGIIDVIATHIDELLKKINNRQIKVLGLEQRLNTTGLEQKVYEPDWRNRLIAILTDPNIAYILMLLGFYGLFFELANPGAILPGVIGGICMLLALFAFQVLPVNYAGIALILLGISFMVGEAFIPSFGILGIGGLIAFIIGSLILIDADVPDYTVSRPLIGGLGIVSVVFFFWVLRVFFKLRSRPTTTGKEEMIGQEGECISDEGEALQIRVRGEIWQARAPTVIRRGQTVKVIGLKGLTLQVEPLDNLPKPESV